MDYMQQLIFPDGQHRCGPVACYVYAGGGRHASPSQMLLSTCRLPALLLLVVPQDAPPPPRARTLNCAHMHTNPTLECANLSALYGSSCATSSHPSAVVMMGSVCCAAPLPLGRSHCSCLSHCCRCCCFQLPLGAPPEARCAREGYKVSQGP